MGTSIQYGTHRAMNLTLENVDVASNEGAGGVWDFGIDSRLKLTKCNVSGDYFAIYHNGSTAPFTLDATNSAITKIGSGEEDACAIYVSGNSTNTANGKNKINLTGCTVTGPTGIEGKYTDMTLVDCTIKATKTQASYVQNNNGSTSLGFAVVSTDNAKNSDSPKPQGTIAIDGGTYTGLVGLSQFEGIDGYAGFAEATYNITSGKFDHDPTEYLAEGAEDDMFEDGGLWVVCGHDGKGTAVSGYRSATCGSNGYSGDTVCSFCDKVLSPGRTIPATGQHAYGEWQTTKEATETDPGTQERACSVCSAKETQEVPALGHAPSEAWQSDAADHWKVCGRCGAELERAPHSFGDWQVTKEATETEPGARERSCSVCGATEAEELPALGHAPSASWSFDAGSHWKACEVCGAELEKAPHAFGEWRTTKEATTQAAGLRERSCSVCGYVQSEETPKLSPVPEGGSGWVESDDGTWGYVDAGEPVEQGWKEVGGEWYYFDDSAMQTGWAQVGGDWYYLEESGRMDTGWKEVGGEWYYLEDTGKMATGWQEVDGEWYYLNGAGEGTEGSMATGWKKTGGEWYYLEDTGRMATGWRSDGGTWYYLNGEGEGTEGSMATGWKKDGGKWYYLAGSGAMRSGWQRVGGTWYLLNAGGPAPLGAMLEGWQRVDASTGRPTSASSWYYLTPGSGAMAASRWVGGYYVNASGLWVR
ncbi:N-acetylmuramoyl-L-alanine amidase family protein [Xiamenia xianingshaonis]|uniref:N-acetylmuramoyl-L-alanine amidase family protein n=1 Tax=Xiamenia xianingshaonis TaxID=2682776 RepID=UPI00140A89EA|nr:N-acetylmuramoyl-L-alanine amidase family protein [Xiamenia xianingshaonis]